MTPSHITPDEEVVFQAAWRIYGRDMQIDICIEEMAELIQAFLKARRKGHVWKSSWSLDILEELADVQICIDQIMLQLNKDHGEPDCLGDMVEEIRTTKITRLMDRLQAEIHLRHEEDEEAD